MYSEWVVIQVATQAEQKRWSVLHKFPHSSGRDVVLAVVRPLASNLGISTSSCEPSTLKNEKEVQWCMEVICYGLGLPLSEHEAIRDCVNVYCEWLLALTKPKACVPQPVCDSPNAYARKMIDHLYNLFVPRSESTNDIISRQAVLCHRVLRTLETLAQDSTLLERETWESILIFLLAINDTLLSPPSVQDDISSKLCERILSVLFEVWLLACHRCFPGPGLWKTFCELCCSWRHRVALVTQWSRITLALNSRLLSFIGSQRPPANCRLAEEDRQLLPLEIPRENVAQAWLRMLHTLGNPVDLCKPEVISQTPKFYHFALSSEMVIDPCQHPCLASLPSIFCKAMHGLATLADSFLGIEPEDHSGKSSFSSSSLSSTPPNQRRVHARDLQPPEKPRRSTATTPTAPASPHPRHEPSVSRPNCNSILHLLGAWLFEAALIGSGLSFSKNSSDVEGGGVQRRPSSLVLEGKSGGPPSTMPDSIEIPSNLTPENFEAGQAEAAGALCRIFGAKRTDEEILPVYLARFYLAVQFGLSGGKSSLGQVMSSILLNSCDLLSQDLDGVCVLVPHFLSALELVLPEREPKMRPQLVGVPQMELRRASIRILLSILALPVHFKDLPIKELCSTTNKPTLTFQSLRPRMMNLLMNALQVEMDPANAQMLLGGLLQSILDATALEKVEHFAQQSPHDLTPSESVAVLLCSDSAYALFVRAIYLVCHRLISTWKTDLNVSLAALEVLSGLAQVHLPQQDLQECKRAVKWICDYIVYQCSRPPPAHSKDLHSTIVAAYHCLTIWLTEHPCLLGDKDSVHVVLEVVELGISGSKSQGKSSDAPILKAEKDLKPASMRVKDAAEVVLTAVMDHVGYFPAPSGPETLSTLLDEESLLQHCTGDPLPPREEAVRSFRYFVLDNGIILALLEQHLGNDQDPQPTVTALLRGPFGRHSWAMQLRQLPRKVSSKNPWVTPSRPLPLKNSGARHAVRHRYFPESVGRIAPCKADFSIPSLEEVVCADQQGMIGLIEGQMEPPLHRPEPQPYQDCCQPELCQEFQTARLFLSHLGSLSLEALQGSLTQPMPSLMELDQGQPEFASHLKSLDAVCSRTCDTVFVFYVKRDQREADKILANVASFSNVHPHFLEFLLSLGWPVDVSRHSGWTGHASTSWGCSSSSGLCDEKEEGDHGGSAYDGSRRVLYWASTTNEVAFVVPSPKVKGRHAEADCEQVDGQVALRNNKVRLDSSSSNRSTVGSIDDLIAGGESTLKPRTLSLNLDHESGLTQGRGSGRKFGREVKVLVVWLESFEDHSSFPLGDLLAETSTGCEVGTTYPSRCSDVFVIFLHALRSGLFRIRIQGSAGRISSALPLVDGMVVSRRVLGTLVLQTSINLCRRRRLDTDSYLPPHVRRRLKIQEIVEKYRMHLPEPEFFTSLFCPMPADETAV